MAEEAFALSPISARAALPSEADYEAIREAFMETSRGRWFLAEYSKRNRNADTSMVLEAVTRMEANLAAQKQAPATAGLIASLGVIRAAIRDAKVTAAEAMPRADDDETLAAARNGARIVREIAWTLRECGADTRICELLDAQVQAIDAGQQRAAADGRAAVLASFDVLVQRIEQIASGNSAPAAAPEAAAPDIAEPIAVEQPAVVEKYEASVTPLFRHSAEAPADFVAPVLTEEPEPVPATAQTEVIEQAEATEQPEAPVEIQDLASEATATAPQADEMTPPAPEDIATAASEPAAAEEVAAPEAATATQVDEIAEDRAVLDMVAFEMAAPDLAEPEMAMPEMDEPPFAEPEIAAPLAPVAEAVAAPEPEAPHHPSLGAALLANGVVPHPNAPASDPLTPIRRMSQAEKIAFFS